MQRNPEFVRAIYDFNTYEHGEISLKKGDVVRVLSKIDTNWLYGKRGVLVGNFPNNFVEPVILPDVSPGQILFVGNSDFISNTEGDLPFMKGIF